MEVPKSFCLWYSFFILAGCILRLTVAYHQGKCEISRGRHRMGTNHAMLGHSYKNFTFSQAYDCHIKCFEEKCRCQAYQIWQKRCELLDEDRFSAPKDFVNDAEYTYYDMNREFLNLNPVNAQSKQLCNNHCCKQNPCANGGKCTELCGDAKVKFNCTCPTENFGRLCHKQRASSCKEQLENDRRSNSGVYQLFDPRNKSLYQVFCDFRSADSIIWTLVESFSLSYKLEFRKETFLNDYPVNQQTFTWKKFRLSWSRMKAIADYSTHVRATCNFDTDGLNYTDYLRAKFSDINVMHFNNLDCKKFEYINIRGHDCINCTAYFGQNKPNWHAHIDSHHGIANCQLQSTGARSQPGGEDNFGLYDTVNPIHRCTRNDTSTTQWWFGET